MYMYMFTSTLLNAILYYPYTLLQQYVEHRCYQSHDRDSCTMLLVRVCPYSTAGVQWSTSLHSALPRAVRVNPLGFLDTVAEE